MTTPNTTCPLCSGRDLVHFASVSDVELFTGPETYDYKRCKDCDCIFIGTFPIDRLAQIYPENYYANDGAGESRSILEKVKEYLDLRLFRNILKRINQPSISVLDIGGGSGWLLDIVRKASDKIGTTTVVDLDAKAKVAAEAKGHKFVQTRIEDFHSDAKFDFILMLNLIEHISDPRAVMERLHSLLSDQGFILIKTPNTDSLDRYLFANLYWGGLHCPRHWILFNPKTLLALVKDCGFRVEEFSCTQGAPQWAQSVLGTMHLQGWIRMSKEQHIWKHPLWKPLLLVFAVFDFLRRPFAKTSQMFVLLRKKT